MGVELPLSDCSRPATQRQTPAAKVVPVPGAPHGAWANTPRARRSAQITPGRRKDPPKEKDFIAPSTMKVVSSVNAVPESARTSRERARDVASLSSISSSRDEMH